MSDMIAYYYFATFILLPLIIYLVGYFFTKGSLNAKKELLRNILIGKEQSDELSKERSEQGKEQD